MHVDYQDVSCQSKEEKYKYLLSIAQEFMNHEANVLATTANITALLRQTFGWFWVGFYWVDTLDELVLGPFQGTLACTRIRYGEGVCGTAWANGKTIIVPDVHLFPGHIACSADSKSEIVVPVVDAEQRVYGVLDIDSSDLDTFDDVDAQYLELLCLGVGTYLSRYQ